MCGSDVDPWNIRFDAINQKWIILNIPTRRVLGGAQGYAKTLFSQGRKRLINVNTESVHYEDRGVILGGSDESAWNDGAPTSYRWNIIPVDDGSESSFLIKNSATGRYLGESVFLGVSSSDRVAMARPENRVEASEPNPCAWRFVPVTTNRSWHCANPRFRGRLERGRRAGLRIAVFLPGSIANIWSNGEHREHLSSWVLAPGQL